MAMAESENNIHRRRERRPPDYLKDYETNIENDDSSTHISLFSNISRRSATSVLSHLSDKQALALASFRKRNELDELKRRQTEDEQIESLLNEAENKAFEAQINAEHELSRARIEERKASKEREKIQSKLGKERDIRMAERRLAELELVNSMIVNDSVPSERHDTPLNPDAIEYVPKVSDKNQTYSVPQGLRHVKSTHTITSANYQSAGQPLVYKPTVVNPLTAKSSTLNHLEDNPTTVKSLTTKPTTVNPLTAQTPTAYTHIEARGNVRVPTTQSHSILQPLTHHVIHSVQSQLGRESDVSAEVHLPASHTVPSQREPHSAVVADVANLNFESPVSVSPVLNDNPRTPITSTRISERPNVPELLLASSYGMPRPTLPSFSSGSEREFAMLKMAFDNLVSGSLVSQQYKYQLLLDRLGGAPKRLAEAYLYDCDPYTQAMTALQETYGQPRQLVQSEIGAILNMPPLRIGDYDAFENLSLSLSTLIGMLRSLEGSHGSELTCGSHVDRILGKLPPSTRDSFVEHCISKGILKPDNCMSYTLLDLSDWLKTKARAKKIAHKAATLYQVPKPCRDIPYTKKPPIPTAVFSTNSSSQRNQTLSSSSPYRKPERTGYCAFCNGSNHHITNCSDFKRLSPADVRKWMRDNNRCSACARRHKLRECNLQKPCSLCNKLHLSILHEANTVRDQTNVKQFFVDQPNNPVMLKIVPVYIHGPHNRLKTHAILDDGSMRTMVMPSLVNSLLLPSRPDRILLSTIKRGRFDCPGQAVQLTISSVDTPEAHFKIDNAFTSEEIRLSDYTYQVDAIKSHYPHLQDKPLPEIVDVKPMLLIGSDNADLITPVKPIEFGPPGAPVAVCTSLGWTLQGPSPHEATQSETCLFTETHQAQDNLLQHVEKLWQMDIIPFSPKQVLKSKEDKFALSLLEDKTVRVPVQSGEGKTLHYATPLLRRPNASSLCVPFEVMMPNLRRTEKHHAGRPELTEIHNNAINKLVDEEFVRVIDKDEASESKESWYIPHHVVTHNNKSRLVFNCSFEYKGLNLNKQLLPGPTIGSSLLGVLLRFRRNKIAISGDIKAMFHQVRLLPEDQTTVRFIWRHMNSDKAPTIYQWQVLPFGTTCSPCCATFALMKHARDAEQQCPEVTRCVNEAFYVDNCLDSLNDPCEAKSLVKNLRRVLAEGGFNIRQWACNDPDVLSDLPPEAKSTTFELWSTLDQGNVNEAALGLHWKCDTDTLAYRHRPVNYEKLNMRAVYQVLATQYDPIGYLTPFTARAKIIIQDMWKGKAGWEEEITSLSLRNQFTQWESELDEIPNVCLNRCYIPSSFKTINIHQQLHVFCDASERIYGSVAYLRTENSENDVHVSFVSARSRVTPKKQLSMPRLELCAALTGAQLSNTLNHELGPSPTETFFWSDSTTVLTWLKSDSCRYKVFVGTRVSEIQSLTPVDNWHYINTKQNPADDLTRGKSLRELGEESRWRNGPSFLVQNPEQWPSAGTIPQVTDMSDTEPELRKTTVLFHTDVISLPDPTKYNTFDDLVNAYIECVDGRPRDLSVMLRRCSFKESRRSAFLMKLRLSKQKGQC